MINMLKKALLAICIWNAITGVAIADWTPGDRMKEATKGLLLQSNKTLTKDSNMGLMPNFSVFGGFVSEKQGCGASIPFVKGKKYIIVASGDSYANDVDIKITNKNGELVTKDDDASKVAMVTFEAESSASLDIDVSLYSGSKGAFIAMAIFVDGGYSVPTSNLRKSIDDLILQCEIANEAAEEEDLAVLFHAIPGQWSVVGGVVPSGKSISLNDMVYPKGVYSIVAAGDSVIEDLDIKVTERGKPIAEDNKSDAYPSVYFGVKATSKYKIEMINADSNGPSLVVLAQLEVLRK
jgi:hypothetical protein